MLGKDTTMNHIKNYAKWCDRCQIDKADVTTQWTEETYAYKTETYTNSVCMDCLTLLEQEVDNGTKWDATYRFIYGNVTNKITQQKEKTQ
jgi:hypothetical protein